MHASSHGLHDTLRKSHQSWFLPLQHILSQAKLPNITLPQNKHQALLLPMTTVRDYKQPQKQNE